MHCTRIQTAQWFIWGILFILNFSLSAQEADNEFTLDAKLNTRAEIRCGGFNPQEEEAEGKALMAHFISGQYRLDIGYQRSWLEIKLAPQFSGIWGTSGSNIRLVEGWALMRTKHGLFAKIGRQGLEYDDERILGFDDWSMTAPTHDVLKLGYEGYGHKLHILLAYNQDAENVSNGGNFFSGGKQTRVDTSGGCSAVRCSP